jgi:tetratricopeptide (TPR) repeat protein
MKRPQIIVFGFIAASMLPRALPSTLQCLNAQGARTPQTQALSFYNTGRAAMADEDWYSAVEDFLECLKLNPAHSEASRALAECYYELGEYDEALNWVRKARQLARLNIETENLEAFILVALGRLGEADAVIKDVLSREPYNREALFAAAELDIARGRAGDAATRFRSAVRLYPDDRRLLVSLALILGSLGDYTQAQTYIDRACDEHPDDHRVFYYAAYLQSKTGRLTEALRNVERSLLLKPDFQPARSLAGSLRYRVGDYDEAIRYADAAIAAKRSDTSAWFLKGMALTRSSRTEDARVTLERALALAPDDEFIRAAFENLLIDGTSIEDASRARWARYHFERAATLAKRYLNDEALFEFRRGLRINPYADERKDYAEILKAQGYIELYLEELRFMQDLGKGTRAINDAVETYNALLSTSLPRVWDIKTEELKRHWNVAVFSLTTQSAYYHTDAAAVASSYIKDILAHDRNINVMNLDTRESSFATAFRRAREAQSNDGSRADYFMIVSISENERDITIKGELYVTRTGAKAAVFTRSRTGQDKLRNACINIAGQLSGALPFRAEIIRRSADRALIDKGKIDGVETALPNGAVFNVIKKGKLGIKGEGIDWEYSPSDLIGTFAVNQIDEEVSAGNLTRQGYFDLITIGDEIIAEINTEENTAASQTIPFDPELRTLLMQLR